jgi:hypothetical protein
VRLTRAAERLAVPSTATRAQAHPGKMVEKMREKSGGDAKR